MGSKDHPYSMEEFELLMNAQTWNGGYVKTEEGAVVYVIGLVFISQSVSETGSETGTGTYIDDWYNWDFGDGVEDYGEGTGTGEQEEGGGGDNNVGDFEEIPNGNISGHGGNNSFFVPNGGEATNCTITTYSPQEAEEMINNGTWHGGYVESIGYVLPLVQVLPSATTSPNSGLHLLMRALAFRDTPYALGGIDKSGIDCSGLISAALNIPRWTTSSGDIPTTKRIYTDNVTADFIYELQLGDILVWNWTNSQNAQHGHCAIYVKETTIFHAHGKAGTPTGETHDLITYWFHKYGLPKIYRKTGND